MRTRTPDHAAATRAKAGLAVAMTLAASLVVVSARAEDAAHPAPTATPAASKTSATAHDPKAAAPHAATPATAATANKPAASKPAANAMVMPKDAPRPGQTAAVAAPKPGTPAATAKPAAVKPVAVAPNPKPAPANPAVRPNPNATVAKPATAPVAPAKAAPAPAATPGKPTAQAVKTGAATGAAIATASHASNVKVTPMVPPPSARPARGVGDAKATPIAPAAQLDEHVTYQYNTLGRRDPFQSYIDGSFVGEDVGGDAPVEVGGMKVVGVVWGETDRFAMVEDGRGNSHVLRRGDKVMNGFVEDLKKDGVVVNLTADGQSQSVTIPLIRKGEKNASR